MEPSNRVYIGSLDPTVTQPEMEAEVRPFGNATSVWVARQPAGFAFIEFSTVQEAQACVASLDGVRIGQQNVTVQFAKSKGRKPPPAGSAAPTPAYSGDRPTPGPGPGRKFRAVLKNLPASFTWRELKDEMRLVGDIIYADVDAQGDGCVFCSG
jgi:RNA recognition motif-containing protein